MGYDVKLMVFKRKVLDQYKAGYPDLSFSDLYSNILYTRLYPETYEFPEDETGRYIYSGQRRIFDDYFSERIGNGEAVLIEEEEYKKMFNWLKNKLKTITLLDIADTVDDVVDVDALIYVYREMRDAEIDFTTEFVVFDHDW